MRPISASEGLRCAAADLGYCRHPVCTDLENFPLVVGWEPKAHPISIEKIRQLCQMFSVSLV